jgi:rhomboid family GlyGly-CTERM serine protease
VEGKSHIVRAGRRSGAPLTLFAASVALFFVPGARDVLEYDRAAVATGEVWRFLTCHLVHGNFEHLFWDAAAVLVLGLFVAAHHPRRFLLVVTAAGAAISVGVHLLLPTLSTYCGLSGIASALFAACAVTTIQEAVRERRFRAVVLTGIVAALFVGKITFELLTGTAVFVDLTAAALIPVPLAHVLGTVSGSFFPILSKRSRANLPVSA